MAITMEELKRKAKAYDGALESAKEIVNNKNASSVWKDWLRNTFPELKESKGEKIRKLLIRLFTSNANEKFDDVSTQEIIAWLEKQGEPTLKAEQSDMQNLNTWSEEDENILNNLIAFLKVEDALQYDWKQIIIWLKSLKERIGE